MLECRPMKHEGCVLWLLLLWICSCSSFQVPLRHSLLLRGSPRQMTPIRTTPLPRGPPATTMIEAPVEQVLQLAATAPALVGMAYHKALTASPTTLDSATGLGLYYLGQRTKGMISRTQPTWDILARWMVIGLVDGFSSHQWYDFLENLMGNFAMGHWQESAAMTVVTAVAYTPAYCAAFLTLLSLLEGKGIRGTKKRLEEDYVQLTQATVSTWSILNWFLFSFVEIENRVTVAMSAHFLYLIGLALWTEGAFSAGDLAPDDGMEEESTSMLPALNLDLPPPTKEEMGALEATVMGLQDDMEPVNFEELAEDLRQELDGFVDDVEFAVEDIEEYVIDMVEDVESAVEDFGEYVVDMVEDVKNNVVDVVKDVDGILDDAGSTVADAMDDVGRIVDHAMDASLAANLRSQEPSDEDESAKDRKECKDAKSNSPLTAIEVLRGKK